MRNMKTFTSDLITDFKQSGYPTVEVMKRSVTITFITPLNNVVQFIWTKKLVVRTFNGKIMDIYRRFHPTKEHFLQIVRDCDDEAWAQLAAEQYQYSKEYDAVIDPSEPIHHIVPEFISFLEEG